MVLNQCSNIYYCIQSIAGQYNSLVVRPNCVPEKVGVNQK
jgi:hypothetical protein